MPAVEAVAREEFSSARSWQRSDVLEVGRGRRERADDGGIERAARRSEEDDGGDSACDFEAA